MECPQDLVGPGIQKALGGSEVSGSPGGQQDLRGPKGPVISRCMGSQGGLLVKEAYEIYKIWEVSISVRTRKIKRSTSSISSMNIYFTKKICTT